MNFAGHLGISSAKNSTDQTWRGILSLGRGSRLPRWSAARRARPLPPAAASGSRTGSEGGDAT